MDKKTTLVLKGIASFMILMYHLSVRNIFSSFGGYFGVGIFYFFSGYNLAYCTINRDDYTKAYGWYKLRNDIEHVVIMEGIENVGPDIFYNFNPS